jgi:hypothetical protein
MSNKKQTAVGWLIKVIDEQQKSYIDLAKKDKSLKKGVYAILTATTLLKMKCNQAKEMEKQHIIDAFENGQDNIDSDGCHIDMNGAEQYFKETYEMKKYIGECKGNDGGGCFLDSCGHDCGCFTVEESKKQQKYDEMLAMLESCVLAFDQLGMKEPVGITQLIKEAKEL